MKESEAKTKWCPMIQVVIGPEDETWRDRMLTSRGDNPAGPEQCLCIGSGCALWVDEGRPKGEPLGHCGLIRR